MAGNQEIRFTVIGEGQGSENIDNLAQSVRNLNGELNRGAKSMNGTGQSAKQMANAIRLIPVQLTDVVTQLAGGQNPFLILLQQGGQVKDMFGGFKPMFEGLRTYLTPVRLGFLGLASALTVLAIAYKQGSDDSSKFNKSIALTNNFAGQSLESYKRLKESINAVYGMTAGDARDIGGGAIASGAFGPNLIGPATQAMAKIKALSGATSDTVVKDFAAMRSGVAAWAAEHNKQYNFLTLEQYRYIRALEEAGNKEEAMEKTVKLLDAALNSRQANLGTLEKMWFGVRDAASSAWDAMLGIGRESSEEDQIKALQTTLAARKRLLDNGTFLTSNFAKNEGNTEVERIEREIRLLQIRIKMRDEEAKKKAETDATNQAAIEREQRLPGIQSATAQRTIQLAENQSRALINVYDSQQRKLAILRADNLIGEKEFIDRSTELSKKKVEASIALAEQERKALYIVETRGEADVINREAKVLAINGKIADLRSQLGILDSEAEAAKVKVLKGFETETQLIRDNTKEIAQNAYERKILASRTELVKLGVPEGSSDFLGAMQSRSSALFAQTRGDETRELAKYVVERQKLIDSINNETAALGKTELEREIAIRNLEIDNEVRQRSIELTNEGKAALEAEAEAIKKTTEEALRRRDATSKSAFTGLQVGVRDYLDNLNNMANSTRDVFNKVVTSMEDSLVEFFTTGKFGVKDFALTIVNELTRAAVRMLIIKPILESFQSAMSGFGVGTGGTGGGFDFLKSLWPFANGGIMTSQGSMPLNKYANGGIANSPQIAMYGEGRMPEAYVPLPDGRTIPVTMQGGGSSGETNVIVNVNVEKGQTDVAANNGDRAGQLGRMIASVVKQELLNQKRPGGLLSAS